MSFADRLNNAMRKRGISQAELARQLEVSAPSVWAWSKGQKQPTTDKLARIATLLDVQPGYLQFGETSGDRDAAADAGEREQYQAKLYWYWRPAPRDHGREYGNAAGYAFETDIDTLTRESGQNICDARIETEPTVEARYTVIELTGVHLQMFLDRIGFPGIRPHLEAARGSHKKAGTVITNGLAQVDSGRLLLVRIEDYNAAGLIGPEFTPGLFMAVARNVLDSQKGDKAGGSFGLGKATLWSTSQFGMVLMNSTLSISEGGKRERRFIGRIDLPWHAVGDVEYAGPGWLGVEDPDDHEQPPRRNVSCWGNRTLASDLYLTRQGEAPGTSFLIVGAYDASGAVDGVEQIADRFAMALADNFWPAMADRPDDSPPRLRAIVRVERNGELIAETFVNPEKFQPAKVAAFRKHLLDEVSDVLDQPGDVVRRSISLKVPRRTAAPIQPSADHEAVLLVVQADDSDRQDRIETRPGTVTFMRGSQMVISAPRVGALPVGARTFHAIVLAGEAAGDRPSDSAADRFLRAAEPPSHNKWQGTPDLTASYVRGGPTNIDNFDRAVKRAIREIIKQPSRDLSDGPESLKELIKIALPNTDARRPRVRTVKNYSVDGDGAWVIDEATISLPARSDAKHWVLVPVLKFGTESGAPIPVKWATIVAGARCTLEGGHIIVPPTARTAKFSAVSDPRSHPVGASRAAVLVDVRVLQEGPER